MDMLGGFLETHRAPSGWSLIACMVEEFWVGSETRWRLVDILYASRYHKYTLCLVSRTSVGFQVPTFLLVPERSLFVFRKKNYLQFCVLGVRS